jgi:hypothetical protein
MKTIGISVPEELFVKPMIVTGFKNGVVSGYTVDPLYTNKNSTWTTRGVFGFVDGDVNSMTDFEKLININHVLEFAKKNLDCEFLFNVVNSTFSIYVRPKEISFG